MRKIQSKILTHMNGIRTFEVVARCKSIRDAALELGVTSGAVSRQIQSLEAALDLKLFHRGHRRISVTEEGADIADMIAPAFSQLRRIDTYLDQRHSVQPIVLAAPASLLLRWIIPRASILQETVKPHRLTFSSWDATNGWRDPSASLCIMIGEADKSPDMLSEPIMAEEFGLVINPTLVASDHGSLRDRALKAPRLIPKTRPQIWQDWIKEMDLDSSSDSPEILQLDRMFFALEAAEAGLGATIAPKPLIQDALEAGRLIAPFGFARRKGHYYAVTERNHRLRAPLQKLTRKLRAEASPH